MKEVFTALSKAQAQMSKARKDSTNPHFKSRYADLESVLDVIREPFAANGLAVIQYVKDGMLFTSICHTSGEFIESSVPLIIAKNDMQGVGSAITYARRYCLAAACGIAQTDDDGEAAVGRPTPTPKAEPKPEVKPPAAKPPVVAESNDQFEYAKHRELAMSVIKELGLSNDFIKMYKDELVSKLETFAYANKESVRNVLALFKMEKETAK
jgi:hypothetical protein